MHKISVLFYLIFLPTLLSGQVLSSKGRFSVEFDTGCAAMTVNITPLDAFGNVTRQYYFFDGAGITNQETFTYQDPGRYRIVQVVGVDGIDDKTDTLFVEAKASLKPSIELTRCSNFELSVQSVDTYYDSIRVYFSPDDSTTFLFGEQTSFTFADGSSQSLRLKGFFNNADQNCSEFTQEVTPLQDLAAPTLTGIAIKETCNTSYTAYITLAAFDTLVNYEILLEQSGNTQTLFDGYLKETSFTLPVASFQETSYCIQVNAVDPCNGATVEGNQVCRDIDEFSLSPFESLYSSYTDDGVFIKLDSLGVGSFTIDRRIEGESFSFLTTTNGSFTDAIGSFSRKYFYQISYVDSCGQTLYTAETHPPFVESEERKNNLYEITYTPGLNQLSGSRAVSYEVGNPGTTSSSTVEGSRFDVRLEADNGSPRQLLYLEEDYSGQLLTSNTITLRHQLIIYVPKAFTPNADGLNDEIQFFGIPSETAAIRIYTRWGKLIHSSVAAQPSWDGKISGSLAPEGTYLYEITFETSTGEKRYQKGTFALINK